MKTAWAISLDEAVERYLGGESTRSIGRLAGVCSHTVTLALRRRGVAIRAYRHGDGVGGSVPGKPRITEYTIWFAMKERCLNHKHEAYPRYGGRGITVCEKWIRSYAAFLADVGRRPSHGHTLDRIDNEGSYDPGNVRWATRREQIRNRTAYECPSCHGRYVLIGRHLRTHGLVVSGFKPFAVAPAMAANAAVADVLSLEER